tara:strand:- start:831 stop:1055 length:225 start_codon:yes stop_codon:yes gene_type:complete
MKIDGGISVGNVWTIVVTLMALAVLWGSSQNRIANIEKTLNRKANKAVVDVKFDFIQTQLSDIKTMLETVSGRK